MKPCGAATCSVAPFAEPELGFATDSRRGPTIVSEFLTTFSFRAIGRHRTTISKPITHTLFAKMMLPRRDRTSTGQDGHLGRMMSERDTAAVETPDFLLAALERASEAVVIVDRDLHVSFFNAAAETIWGLTSAEVLGGHVSRLGLKELHREDGDDAPAGHACEVTIERRDGSRVRAALSVSHVGIGGQSRSIAFVRDVTKEIVRRERMAVLNLVADKTNRAVVVTDRNLKVVYANAAFTAMFGYGIEEAQDRRATELLVGQYTDRRTLTRLRRWIDTEAGGEEEILAYDKNGDEIWISASVKAFRDTNGRVKYMFALLDRHHRDQAAAVAAATDHGRARRRNPDHRDRRPAVPTRRGDRARRGFLAAPCRRRRSHSSARRPEPARRLFPRAGRRRDRPECRLLRYRRLLRHSRCWRPISTPIRAGSRTRRCRSKRACAPAGRRRSRPRTAASSAPSRSISGNAARRAAGINASSTPASISRRSRSSARKRAPRSRGSPITTC